MFFSFHELKKKTPTLIFDMIARRYLHGLKPQILYRELTTQNVLITSDGGVKVHHLFHESGEWRGERGREGGRRGEG